jgi:F0F1-type ATP synthase assembly protein I
MKTKQNSQKSETIEKKQVDVWQYMVYGFIVGLLIGVIADNLTLWSGTGLCLGLLIGSVAQLRS